MGYKDQANHTSLTHVIDLRENLLVLGPGYLFAMHYNAVLSHVKMLIYPTSKVHWYTLSPPRASPLSQKHKKSSYFIPLMSYLIFTHPFTGQIMPNLLLCQSLDNSYDMPVS